MKLLSRDRLFVTPWTVANQAPSMRFSRQEYWSELPFPSPEDLPDSGKTLYHLSHQGSPYHMTILPYDPAVSFLGICQSQQGKSCMILLIWNIKIGKLIETGWVKGRMWSYCLKSTMFQFVEISFRNKVVLTASHGFEYNIVWKNLNKIFGQPII